MNSHNTPRISVCIATCRRPRQLAALLEDLRAQSLPAMEVIVVDNDSACSAAEVTRAAADAGLPVLYSVEPEKNIAHARNRSVLLASGDWLAFIDDDERAPPEWLLRLLGTAVQCNADGVLAPVLPGVPADAPAWIRRGSFYDWARQKTGAVVPLNRLRFGNVMLARHLLSGLRQPFDPAYGLTGGEDGDLLTRLAHQGAKLVWSDEAVVHEPVEQARLSLRWLLRRSLRGGQDFARHTLNGRYGAPTPLRRLGFVARAAVQMAVAALLALLLLPAGLHHSVRWLAKASANFGKLSILWGWHYREYA